MDSSDSYGRRKNVAEPPQPPEWLRGLEHLLEALRQHRFAISPDVTLRLHRLLLRLAEIGKLPRDPLELKTYLAPILATRAEQQTRFAAVFARWAEPYSFGDRAAAQAPAPPAAAPSRREVHRGRGVAAIGVAIAVAVLIWLIASSVMRWVSVIVEAISRLPQRVEQISSFSRLEILLTVAFLCSLLLGCAYFSVVRRLRIMTRKVTGKCDYESVRISDSRARSSRAVVMAEHLRVFGWRRIQGSFDFDLAASLQATVSTGGLPVLRTGTRRFIPEYLVLIERRSDGDHLFRLGLELVDAMQKEALFFASYTFNDAPHFRPLERGGTGLDRPLSFGDIAQHYANSIVIIVSDGERLISPKTNRVFEWVTGFQTWSEIFLFTPVPPMLWREPEASLAQHGIVPVFFGEASLARMADALRQTATLATFRSNAGEGGTESDTCIPHSLVVAERPWLEDTAPPVDRIERMFREMQGYLDQDGFRWLCACAVFPRLLPVLTNSLGRVLKDTDAKSVGTEERLLKLTRLPWFRHGRMPGWLRMRLLAELDGETIDTVIDEVRRHLDSPSTGGLDDSLSVSRAGSSESDKTDFQPDRIFVDFASGRTTNPLSFPAPANWVRYTPPASSPRTKFGIFILGIFVVGSLVAWALGGQWSEISSVGQHLGRMWALPLVLVVASVAQFGLLDWIMRAFRQDNRRGLLNLQFRFGVWQPMAIHVASFLVLMMSAAAVAALAYDDGSASAQAGAVDAPGISARLSDIDILKSLAVATIALAAAIAFQLIEPPVHAIRAPMAWRRYNRPPLLDALIRVRRPSIFLLWLFLCLTAVATIGPAVSWITEPSGGNFGHVNVLPMAARLLSYPALGLLLLFAFRGRFRLTRKQLISAVVVPVWLLFATALAPLLLDQLIESPGTRLLNNVLTSLWFYAGLAVMGDRLRVLPFRDGMAVAIGSCSGAALSALFAAMFSTDAVYTYNWLFYNLAESAALLWLLRRYLALSAGRLVALGFAMIAVSSVCRFDRTGMLPSAFGYQFFHSPYAILGLISYPLYVCLSAVAVYALAFGRERTVLIREGTGQVDPQLAPMISERLWLKKILHPWEDALAEMTMRPRAEGAGSDSTDFALISGWRRLLLWPYWLLIVAWGRTLRFETSTADFNRITKIDRPILILLWHNRLFIAPEIFRRSRRSHRLYGLTGEGGTSAWLTAVMAVSGVKVLRGSSGQFGGEAAVAVMDTLRAGSDIALTPDGPRGPRYDIQPGVAALAYTANAPVLLIGAEFSSAWLLNSWDRFYLPKPFSRIRIQYELIEPGQLAVGENATRLLRVRLLALNPDSSEIQNVLILARKFLSQTKTGAIAAKVDRIAEEMGSSADTLISALVGAGLSVPRESRVKPVFVEEGGEIFWLNRNAKGELWLNAKRSKFAAATGKVLSIIVPIYNECATARAALDAIVAKKIPGMTTEIIIVESNSTDGTRDIVLSYQNHPHVKLVLEDKPCGKGHAVRAGLVQATGEVILIQDADLEYDLGDYDILIAPIMAGRQHFVLGSRHGEGGWAIRRFSDQPLQALLLNMAHWGFTLMLNFSLGVWMRDPFTMYKVFRRDCLEGLTFECNRFDFDWELVIKLIRKGYRPIEIPVSYRSRSFKEGKKISIFRDPITWVWALVKYRFQRLNVERPESKEEQVPR